MKALSRILAGFVVVWLVAPIGARTAFIEQPDFSVEGVSTEKVFEVNEWAREWFRYLRSHGVDVPPGIPPIRIIVSAGSGGGQPAGTVGTVLVGGGSGLDRDSVIDGIVAASLTRYARWRGLSAVPAPWFVSGLTEHFLVYWNPARRDLLSTAVLHPNASFCLQTSLQAQPASMTERGTAFALLSEVGWPVGGALLIDRLLVNAGSPFAGFSDYAEEAGTEGDLWLATILADFHLSTGAPIWNLDTSAWRLEWLAAVPAEWRGQRYRRQLLLLWNERDEPERQAWLEERLRLTKGAIAQIHPVYHNAAHSLGWVWESILEGEGRDILRHRIRHFEEDLIQAHRLRAMIEETVRGE